MSQINETKDIYYEIKNMIKSGMFAPNERLNQLQLAEKLKVSRTPVATALHMLAAEGYLDQKHNSGFYVHNVTLQNVLDLLLARASLESTAAYDIAEHADEDALKCLADELSNMENQTWVNNQVSRNDFLKADHQWHKTLLESCRNTWVIRMNDNIKILEHPNALGILREPAEVIKEHRQVMQAILARDPLAAQIAMYTHILHTRNIVMEATRNIESVGMDVSQLFQFSNNHNQ